MINNYKMKSEYDRYRELDRILGIAWTQAAIGKGVQRHGSKKPFQEQIICEITRRLGLGFPLGQVWKKTHESLHHIKMGKRDAAIAELLGAINYIAAAILVIEEMTLIVPVEEKE